MAALTSTEILYFVKLSYIAILYYLLLICNKNTLHKRNVSYCLETDSLYTVLVETNGITAVSV